MGNIIRLQRDRHHETQRLLPWYATGQLDDANRTRVEAHLSGCPECRAELKLDQRLQAEVGRLPMDVEQAWALMRRRVEAKERPLAALGARAGGAWRAAGPWLGWVAATAILLVASPQTPNAEFVRAARYQALSAGAARPAGDVVVMFRPDANEPAMRRSLQASDARLVGGPTAAGAYVLYVPPARRGRALATLRARREVVLAEPIDASDRR